MAARIQTALLTLFLSLSLGACTSGSGSAPGNLPPGALGSSADPGADNAQAPELPVSEDPGRQSSAELAPPTPAPDDSDGDEVPDEADLWPEDPSQPGVTSPYGIYGHSRDTLYALHIKTLQLKELGRFEWPDDGAESPHEMTDIAIDRYGVIYGLTFEALYTCNADTLACTHLGFLPPGNRFNGLSFVPEGVLEPDRDVLIGVSVEGSWTRLDVTRDATIKVHKLGSYGGDYKSAGDVFSIQGVGTFAAVSVGGPLIDNVLAEVDPKTGKVLREVSRIDGYSSVYGLAGAPMQAYAFDAGGDIILIRTDTAEVKEVVHSTDITWWGAGVRTFL
jgi:hypothetical protein